MMIFIPTATGMQALNVLHITKLYVAEVPSTNKVKSPPWKVWADTGEETYALSKPFKSACDAKLALTAIQMQIEDRFAYLFSKNAPHGTGMVARRDNIGNEKGERP